MKQERFRIKENQPIALNTYRMKLNGDIEQCRAGGFVNVKIDGLYLRRPISVCDAENGMLTLIYKVVGKGTEILSEKKNGTLDLLVGLGNGYDLSLSGESPLLIGGGAGVPPLYMAAKLLTREGRKVRAVLGFNKAEEVFLEKEFLALGAETTVVTADGSKGEKGLVTDYLPENYTHFYACGPEPMLKAVCSATKTDGQLSFEERMGCGFGACMGCSCRTVTGNKRICREGPVLKKSELLWNEEKR